MKKLSLTPAALLVALAGTALGQATTPFPAQFELSSLLPANGGDGSDGFVINGFKEKGHSGFSVDGAGDINGDEQGGGGFGMVHDNNLDKTTYMKMAEFGVGLGLGVKDFRAVFIFNDASTMRTFTTSGWEWGGEADAAAKLGDQGGAAEAAGDIGPIEVYQITKNGVALSATVSGTKYWKDTALNTP